MSGDFPGRSRCRDGFVERPWRGDCGARSPTGCEAPPGVQPPPACHAMRGHRGARSIRNADGARARSPSRPSAAPVMGITHPIVGGAINLYQIGEWATAHVIRHNKQAKQVLGYA